jgi:hypothetical protein
MLARFPGVTPTRRFLANFMADGAEAPAPPQHRRYRKSASHPSLNWHQPANLGEPELQTDPFADSPPAQSRRPRRLRHRDRRAGTGICLRQSNGPLKRTSGGIASYLARFAAFMGLNRVIGSPRRASGRCRLRRSGHMSATFRQPRAKGRPTRWAVCRAVSFL